MAAGQALDAAAHLPAAGLMRRNEFSEPSAEPVMIAKELPEATRERRLPRGGPPAATLLDPRRDRLRVGPGLAAEHRGLPGERFIQLALAGALEDPGHLGQEVGPAVRELAGARPPRRPPRRR